MFDLTSNISAIMAPVSLVAQAVSKESSPSSLKINGLSCFFIPSEKPDFQSVLSVFSSPIQEVVPAEEFEDSKIECELLESLDSDEESVESLEEEIEEQEESEECSFSEDKAESLDGDFFGEESFKEAFFETSPKKIVIDERFKKMWQRNRLSLLEILERESKMIFAASQQECGSLPIRSLFKVI